MQSQPFACKSKSQAIIFAMSSTAALPWLPTELEVLPYKSNAYSNTKSTTPHAYASHD
jgi:hypothetical protein